MASYDVRHLAGSTAVVTGASSGIGAAIAHRLAASGLDLVLVARSTDRLGSVARAITDAYGVAVEVVGADLTAPGECERVHGLATADGRGPVTLLVNNAGFAAHGRFHEVALETQLAEIDLNVSALVELTHRFLPDLIDAGRGGVVNIASTAAFQPVGYLSVYAASKAFVLSFSEGLAQELRDTPLTVLALCPGATDTAFFDTVGSSDAQVGALMSPERVADDTLRAFARGRGVHVVGRMNRLLATLPRIVPRTLTARIATATVTPTVDDPESR